MDNQVDKFFATAPLTQNNIKINSKEVKKGDVFVAIKGTMDDGHNYILDAFRKGASYVLCEHEVVGLAREALNKIIIVEDARMALADMAKRAFKDPSKDLSVYGITGTNGKTTTTFVISNILERAKRPAGLVSTVFIKTKGSIFYPSPMTTPDVITLNRLLSEMVRNGKLAAAIEVSSHALSQGRILGIALDSAVFTNLTPEHLDYHKDMTTYLEDKSKIFKNLKPGGRAALNADDPMVIGLVKKIKFGNLATFGLVNDADVTAKGIKLTRKESEFDLVIRNGNSIHVRTKLIGRHNVYNMLAAVAAVLNSNLNIEDIKEGLESSSAVPGRLEAVSTIAPFSVFVDYAHTPDALECVLKYLRVLSEKRLICVFGCGGDRDKTKRPLMGAIASNMCDHVILTSDNPRSEKPEDILEQIENGMRGRNNYSIITERRDALKEALSMASKGDIVIVAGKGHEDYQILGARRIHFDDREVVSEILREFGY